MRGMIRRALAALLALGLLPGLTACGEKEEARKLLFQSAPAYTAEDIALPVPAGDLIGCCTDGKYMYILADEKAGEDARSVLCRADLDAGTAAVMEDYRASDVPEDAAVNRLGPTLAPDGTLWLYEIWTVSTYDLPEGFDETKESKGRYLTSRDEFHHLRQLDPVTGREKKVVDLSEAVRALTVEGSFDAADIVVDAGENVYFAWNKGIAVLDREGNNLFTLEASLPGGTWGSAAGRLVLLPDGQAAALTDLPGGKREVRTISLAAKDWGTDAYPVPGEVSAVYNGGDACLFYFIQGDVLYGAVAGEIIPQRLLTLGDTRIKGHSGTVCFALLDQGRLALLVRRIPGSDRMDEVQLQLALLSPTDQMPEDGKIKIVYGTIGDEYYMRSRIEAFNEASDTYYVEYRSYTGGAVWDTPEGFRAVRDAAHLRLNAEIAAGRAPDIMSGELPLDIYAQAGLLEDLWPWIDSDPEISREGLMDHVLECASTDGKLYSVGSGFTIQTAVTSAETAGDRTGWTMEEMLEAYGGTMPEMYMGPDTFLTKCNAEEMLRELLSMDLARYVDRETGTCRFDGEDFCSVLRLCASAGNEAPNYEQVLPPLWEGGPFLCKTNLRGVRDLVSWDVLFGGPGTLEAEEYEAALWDAGVLYTFISPIDGEECVHYGNADFFSLMKAIMDGRLRMRIAAGAVYGMPDGKLYAAFTGTPSSQGTGGSFTLTDRMAISASSQAKEGAWAFVRSLLLPGGYLQGESFDGMDMTSSYGFPIDRSDFETLLEPRWCRVDGDGELLLDKEGQPIEVPAKQPMWFGDPIVMAAYQMPPNEAQMERFWRLYDSIDRMSGDDRILQDIILEQAAPYFAGDKSLEETADLIQRRAQLYVNENR